MMAKHGIKCIVTPHAGVWIETVSAFFVLLLALSLPTRECGLKHAPQVPLSNDSVTPHAGVWIETPCGYLRHKKRDVTPHAGVWIETSVVKSIS